MIRGARYAHTNLIARDWRVLAAFYQRLFGCLGVPPERHYAGPALEAGTGVAGSTLDGVHLRLPGHGADGPTLEIYSYSVAAEGPVPAVNRPGFAHLAFEVDSVDEARRELLAAGGRALGEVVTLTTADGRRVTWCYVTDPEGNALELQSWDRPQVQSGVPRPQPPVADGVRTGYDRWALVYDHDQNPLPALEEPVVRELLGAVRGLRALDLGCGTGRHASWLVAAGAEVTAVDFSEGMLEEARRKPGAACVRFVVHDLHRRLPFEDAAFDLVVSGLVLEHLNDPGAFFLEAHRVLRPGRRALVSAMHPAMFLRGTQARFTDPASGERVQPGSLVHSLGEMVTAASRAGFALEDVVERAPDAAFAQRYPRAEKYLGWPMLVVLALRS